MHWPRHRRRSSAPLFFSLLSVLALLAFAGVPAVAQAECSDSSCAEYKVEIPESGAGNHKKHPNPEGQNEAPATASKQPGTHKEAAQPGEPETSEESRHQSATGGGGNGGGNGKGPGANEGGGQNKTSPKGNNTGVGEEEAVRTTQGQPVSHSSGGGSPLVPILIAVAVLAAISIGAVIYRQRRQGGGGSGSPVSPNAG